MRTEIKIVENSTLVDGELVGGVEYTQQEWAEKQQRAAVIERLDKIIALLEGSKN